MSGNGQARIALAVNQDVELLSLVAGLQAPVIMMSQNRQESKDRIRAEHDYEVNLKAEMEIEGLHEKRAARHQVGRLPLFEISDDAMELILARLEVALAGRPELRHTATRVGLRLNLRAGRAHLSLETPRPTDRVMSFMGRTLLIVDPRDFARLERTRLTVERRLDGKTLSMEPNVPEKAA